MKNLYPKGKGKIHPSPAPPSAGGGNGGSSPAGGDALAVLTLLPAAILGLTAALGNEDKEVVAYLITRSINGPAAAATAAAGERRRRCWRPGGLHRPLFDCGCFDCYTSFWSRWDCSPDRELIHQVIEAFEEHLANTESSAGAGAGGGRARRRERRAGDRAEKGKKGKERMTKKADEAEDKNLMAASSDKKEEFTGEEAGVGMLEATEIEPEVVAETAEEEEEEEEEKGRESELAMVAAPGGERRRGWLDVIGLFNSRLWSLWNPGF